MLAHTLVSLDRLSNGRVIFAAGLGGTEPEFEAFGESADAKRRAAMLDEGLQVLDGLLCGETVNFHGQHYTVNGVTLVPRPVQQPRPPIWIGGGSRAALRRAARWDGWSAGGVDESGQMVHPPEWFAEKIAYIQQHRQSDTPFDVAVSGCTAPGDAALPRAYAAAGATWWFENVFGYRGTVDEMLARIHAGPPR
jgi:alkanesulfonate monooxygenase SsuD/methylene tetrahydromethanopterin reductase-like flavin-dependent oxidoreductase (luciferase family)